MTAAKHGYHGTPTYRSWASMIQRCTNPKRNSYRNYGARGITVCERWQSFENFLADMGPRPAGTTLDRFPNNDGNYEPGNARWATKAQQTQNTRTNRLLSLNGETHALKEWARRIGITHKSIQQRLNRGMSVEEALTKPKRPWPVPRVQP